MRLIIAVVLLLTANLSYGSQCSIVEYDDHFEAVCEGGDAGDSALAPSQQPPHQAQAVQPALVPVQEQAAVSAADPDSQPIALEQAAYSEEARITRSEIGRRHVEYWLASTPRY